VEMKRASLMVLGHERLYTIPSSCLTTPLSLFPPPLPPSLLPSPLSL
jgi:hypothetical protein